MFIFFTYRVNWDKTNFAPAKKIESLILIWYQQQILLYTLNQLTMSPTTQDLKFIDIVLINGKLKPVFIEDSLKEFFTEFSKIQGISNIQLFGGQHEFQIRCQKLQNASLFLSVQTGKDWEYFICCFYAVKINSEPIFVSEAINNLEKFLVNCMEKNSDFVCMKIDKLLNEMYKQVQKCNPKQTETKPQNTQETQPVQVQSAQEIQQPTEPVIESIMQATKPAISPKEFYSKEFTVKHLEYYIPNDFRELVKKYGVKGNKTNILRAINLKSKIYCVMMRKTKAKSVLRVSKSNSNNLVLKIGTGDYLLTNLSYTFEWRESHTEENIQHIKDAFVELNKWYKEKKELFEKEKIAEEFKKKEIETKLIEGLEKGEFKPLE